MEAEFVVTGSQVYGQVTKDSDIDIVLRMVDAEHLKNWLTKHKIQIEYNENSSGGVRPGDEYEGFYYRIDGMTFNIIVAKTNDELKAWRKATEKMLGREPIKDKKRRCALFSRYLKPYDRT